MKTLQEAGYVVRFVELPKPLVVLVCPTSKTALISRTACPLAIDRALRAAGVALRAP